MGKGKIEMRMLLTRGLPGSGKSALATSVAKERGGVVFSADDFFTAADGTHRIDLSKVPEAHKAAQYHARAAAAAGAELIIIDNTHTRQFEMLDYIRIAANHGATDIGFLIPQTSWAWDAEECARRTVHAVLLP